MSYKLNLDTSFQYTELGGTLNLRGEIQVDFDTEQLKGGLRLNGVDLSDEFVSNAGGKNIIGGTATLPGGTLHNVRLYFSTKIKGFDPFQSFDLVTFDTRAVETTISTTNNYTTQYDSSFSLTYADSFDVSGLQVTLVGTKDVNFVKMNTDLSGVIVNLSAGTISTADNNSAPYYLQNIQVVQFKGTYLHQVSTFLGLTSGIDFLGADSGISGTNTFVGQGATDYIQGGSGTNLVYGGTGNEIFYGNGGQDTMAGGTGQNYMQSGPTSASTDVFYGKGGQDFVYGGLGTTVLLGGSGTEVLTGGIGFNELIGSNTATSALNVFNGGPGTDVFYAGVGINLLHEATGTDVFAGNSGQDYVYGGAGRSFVYAGSGTTVVTTGAGNQYVQAGSGQLFFNDTTVNLTAGRFDQIDNFAGSGGVDLYMPAAVQGTSGFVAGNGGAAVVTTVNGGTATLFASGADVATLQAHTHFTLT